MPRRAGPSEPLCPTAFSRVGGGSASRAAFQRYARSLHTTENPLLEPWIETLARRAALADVSPTKSDRVFAKRRRPPPRLRMLPLRRASSNIALRTVRSVAVSRRTIVIGRDHGNFNTVLLMVPQAEEWMIERFGKFNRLCAAAIPTHSWHA